MDKKNLFENYADGVLQLDLLNKKVNELNDRCADINQRIDEAELRNDTDSVEFLSCMYNSLTEQRIELELEKNKKERELLEFELAAIRAE